MEDFILGNDVLLQVVAFGLILIPAVIVHEFGHFLAAKLVGITVLEFGIGFPPKIGKLFTWGETEFTLNWIPIGGFVRPLGEDLVRPVGEEATERDRNALVSDMSDSTADRSGKDPGHKSEVEELAARGIYNTKAVHEATPMQRIFFMAAGALFNFIFALIIFVVVASTGVPEVVGDQIGFASFAEDSPLTEIGLLPYDAIDELNGEPFADHAALADRLALLIGEPVTVRVLRSVDDAVETLELEFVATQQIVDSFVGPDEYVLITSVDDDSPAMEAGLQANDLIAYFDGNQVFNNDDPSAYVSALTHEAAGQQVTLTVIRGGEQIEVSLVPRLDPPVGRGRMGIGIANAYSDVDFGVTYLAGDNYEVVPQSLGASLTYGVDRIGLIFRMIGDFPSRLMSGDAAPEEKRIISVVGVSQIGGKLLADSIEENSYYRIIDFVGLISIALGVTNLLPIPALDGGRIFFVLIELVRGKPLPPEKEGLVHLAGLVFMLLVGVLFIINDLSNPLTDLIQ
jgi:regulator of sigma E protease